jgi:hypothetical protein
MGCCFESKTAKLSSAEPDPSKHVNYTVGMVLGEDDFRQEFAYLSGRDQWLARDLVGYGTVRGLKLRSEWDGGNGPRVYVDAGAALTPRGQLVCVPTPQCANVNAWLAKHAAELRGAVGSPPAGAVSLYVLLCYRECPTDDVPIPGEPCRSEDQLVKPSRLKDDFVLQLSLTAPEQREEKALQDYCDWLRRVEMGDAAATSPPLEQFLNAIRQAAVPWFSPPASPPPGDFLYGSPPATLRVHPSDATRYLRAAFDLWVTELRPKWHARWHGCAPGAFQASPIEDCVLLGELRVSLVQDSSTGTYMAVSSELPRVYQDQRPYVLHLRMLQEWLLCGRAGGADAISAGNSVVPETGFGLLPAAGSHSAYARADHTHGTPPLPIPGGDLGGTIASAAVNRIKGFPVALATPMADGMILSYQAGQWVASQPPQAAARYIVQETAAGLPNAQSLGALATGLVKNTQAGTRGTLSIATQGTDYYAPNGTDVAVADGGTGLSAIPGNGQLLIGNGAGYSLGQIQGTPRRVIVTLGAGSIALSLPQDIARDSMPAFGGLFTSGQRTIGVLNTNKDLKLDEEHHAVICNLIDGNITLQLPKLDKKTQGRVYIIRLVVSPHELVAAGVPAAEIKRRVTEATRGNLVTLQPADGNTVDGDKTLTLALATQAQAGRVAMAVTLLANAELGDWHIIGLAG